MITTLPLTCFALAAALVAQEPQQSGEQAPPPMGQESQREMVELFGIVERKLRQIDQLLYDAGTGEVPQGPVEDAGIERLLRQAADNSREVQSGIDRILEIARQMDQQQSQSQGGSSRGSSSGGPSPLDQKRPEREMQKENKPEGPAPRTPGEEQKQPQDGQDRPQDGREDPTDPAQRTGSHPPQSESEKLPVGEDAGKWGELPPTAREIFTSQGGGDLPPQYRDWIDAYYRRLNQRR